MSDSLWPHGLSPTRLLCSWNFAGKNTGMGWHFVLQGIFPTHGSNPPLFHLPLSLMHLLPWKIDSLPVHHPWSPPSDLKNLIFEYHCYQCSEKAMASHSSTLAWKIPWLEKPGRLPSMGSHRVGHDWSDLAAINAILTHGNSWVKIMFMPIRYFSWTFH